MNLRLQRKKLNLSQTRFWEPMGVTQSTGSRYEGGMELPDTVKVLLSLRLGKSPLTDLAGLRNTTVNHLMEVGK